MNRLGDCESRCHRRDGEESRDKHHRMSSDAEFRLLENELGIENKGRVYSLDVGE